jgi:hypothetical protein
MCRPSREDACFGCQMKIKVFVSDPECESVKVLPLDEPLVYLTVSALASVNLFGKRDTLHLVMNWQKPKDAIKQMVNKDWVGLFDKDPNTMNGTIKCKTDEWQD